MNSSVLSMSHKTKKILLLITGILGALVVILLLIYIFTPSGKMLFKAVKSGLIFHPNAYSAALFPQENINPRIEKINLPPGFRIEIFADNVKNARSLALSDEGTVFVGTRKDDKVYALKDTNGDFGADEIITIAEGLTMPNGVAVKDGNLYVAEMSRILRFNDIDENLKNPPDPEVVFNEFPEEKHHGWKFIAFGPDGRLYVPIGAPCNICDRGDPFASITRMNAGKTGFEIFARGVRNTVGFDWHPETGVLWFTDNGRDWMGDDNPPDELNSAPRAGLHFGYPYCHGKGIPDPEYGNIDCSRYQNPEIELGPHVAALGMRFYTGSMFPDKYRNNIFISEHGSWNRTVPIGYRITLVTLEENRAVKYEVFADGWRAQGETWGRPVDVLVFSDGSLLVSDDMSGTIYRITYQE